MGQATVLLIDDDVTQLKLGRLRLRDAGYNVVTAIGGDDALAKIAHFVPTVILSDVRMADLDGFVLCRRLREQRTLDEVPIILLSSHYDDARDHQLATQVGAFELVGRTPDFQAELDALRRGIDTIPEPGIEARPQGHEQHVRTTSSKLTELVDKVRQAEQRYRVLFEAARDAIALLTEDGRILEVNARWEALLDIPVAALVGRHISEFAAPGFEAENVQGFRATLDDPGMSRGALRHRDGRLIYAEFSNSMIELDGRRVCVSICRDVTTAYQTACALAAAEERYRSLVERLPDAIWSATADGTLTFVTQNVLGVCGFTAEELMKTSVEDRNQHIHPDDAPAVSASFRACVLRGEPFDIEYRRRRPDGRWIWLRNRATARVERDGAVHIEGMLTDVTERKLLEQSLLHAQKMEAIGQLTGGIAHDFNNILGAILASAQFLTEDLAESDPRREDAVTIELAAGKAAALTRQLLAFSRRQVLEPKVVKLEATVAGMERMLRRLLTEDIELIVTAEATDAQIRVDESQLEQVVMNLVVNARDAMPAGGKLVIETAAVLLDELAGAQIDVPPGLYSRLLVRDEGCGIDADTRRRMFEPFFTTKPAGRGTGLGLSTCYGIIKQSGGFISVASQVDHGTSFSVYLPCVDAVRRVEPELVDSRQLRGHETVLLVEDDDRVRALVRRILSSRGYFVLTASNGADALEVVSRTVRSVDLVLSDVSMPGGMSGPALMRALRDRWPAVPVIYMSGHITHITVDDRDATNLIDKPFTHEAIARKLRAVLDQRSV